MIMAASSPESDLGSIECFQNYTAPEVFVQGLAGQINQQDVEAIIRAQKQMLQRFEKTNEMLSNCNALSATRFALAQKEFKKHTALLVEMKKDLDHIFKRIRNIKTKLSNQYPSAFTAAQEKVFKEADEDEEGESSNRNQVESSENNKRTSVSGESAQSGHSSKSEQVEEMEQSSDGSRADTERQMKKTASSSSDSSSSAKLSSSSSFDN